MQKKSAQVALGGIATGMCIALMFATGMIPFSYYALPALAGLVLIAVREENGLSTALIVFAAVSLLSVFVVPIKEAALLFIAFFGYYPILQESFAKIRPGAPLGSPPRCGAPAFSHRVCRPAGGSMQALFLQTNTNPVKRAYCRAGRSYAIIPSGGEPPNAGKERTADE